jgi:prephenate dehydrogenase
MENKKIGFLGPVDSFCARAAQDLFPRCELNPYPSTRLLFQAVASHEVDHALVPLESQMEGPVTETLDHLFEFAEPVKIVQVVVFPLQEGKEVRDRVKVAVLGREYAGRTGNDTTALAIYPHRDRIGLLEDILYIISREYRLNLSSIHSRPDTKGGFRFHIELEGHLQDPTLQGCLLDLERKLSADEVEVKVFGAYPRQAFIEPRIKAIGIIGGTGRMGAWLASFFNHAGYQVLVSGRRTSLTYRQCVERSDVVIVNVPIPYMVQVIQDICPYLQPGQLIVDNASVKTQPVDAMLSCAPEGVEVLGMHTIFGPTVTEIRHQNVVFTYTPRSGELCQEFEGIFYKYGARITRTTPEFHDQQMAFHQNLEHFTKIALAELLRRRFGTPQAISAYTSPNSRLSLIAMGRILNLDPQLVSEIQQFNLQGPAMIRDYLEIVKELAEAMAKGDPDRLRRSMAESSLHMGRDFLGEMLETSQEIERHLAELEIARRRKRTSGGGDRGSGSSQGRVS